MSLIRPAIEVITWADLSALLLDFKNRLAQGCPKGVALPRTLQSSGHPVLMRLGEHLQQPFADAQNLWLSASEAISDPSLRDAFVDLYTGFAAQPDGLCRLEDAGRSLEWKARTSRLFSQSLAQIRAQSSFFIWFIPLLSIFLIWRGFQNFFENVSTPQGRILLCVAMALYFAGLLLFRTLEGRALQLVLSDSLSESSGQLKFLEALSLSGYSLGRRTEAVCQALENLRGGRWKGAAGALRLGRPLSAVSEGARNRAERRFPSLLSLGKGDRDNRFLRSVRSQILESPAEQGARWTEQTMQTLREQLRDEVVHLVSRLNLFLLFPLALFFLPALFLMLFLTGSSQSAGAVG